MSRIFHTRFHSARVRADMRALDLREFHLPFGTMLVSLIAGANAASLIATLLNL